MSVEDYDTMAKASMEDTSWRPVLSDGKAFVTEASWKVGETTPYIIEPRAENTYVTTSALRSQVDFDRAAVKVKTLDLDPQEQRWMGTPRFDLTSR